MQVVIIQVTNPRFTWKDTCGGNKKSFVLLTVKINYLYMIIYTQFNHRAMLLIVLIRVIVLAYITSAIFSATAPVK